MATVTTTVSLTQAAYNALAPPDPNTLYIITDVSSRGPQGLTGPPGPTGAASTVPGPPGPSGAYTGTEVLVDKGNVSGSINCDVSTASVFRLTLTGPTTITFTNPQSGSVFQTVLLRIIINNAAATLDVVNRRGGHGANPFANLPQTVGSLNEAYCRTGDNGAHWDCSLGDQLIA